VNHVVRFEPPRPEPGPEPRPDWVMMGVPHGGGVRLYASRELNAAELEMARDYVEVDPFDLFEPARLTPWQIKLTVEMRTFYVIEALTYQDAFAGLFKTWSPDDARRKELT